MPETESAPGALLAEGAPDPAQKNPAPEAPAQEKRKQKPKKDKPRPGPLSDLITLLLKLVWILALFAALLLFVFGVAINGGTRMEPAMQDQDIVVYYRMAENMAAGETVVYRNGDGRKVTGRIVAVGGDTVEIDERGLMVNGYYTTDEHAVGETVLFAHGVEFPLTLKAGEYFVLCGDRSQEDDSRTLGALTDEQIDGRVMLLIRHRDF